ncbi:uncharacterized protein YdhG (YjbR/CyaY superfamily) [Dysgonomonas sp. PFB1-18]|uniref:DUF1801 domain-containing protein n=1 Tax=unclassified Dysgonomonas TaxID=2630389 RepID=UPI002475FB3A|nr:MULTISPECIES: DUF1801 domain-containing protein [unclassified Dysgonomonas]MDH6308797.1 uncharacterized protein YdhG (YjbR/CyaY superfamily) [Dysgonomonas sp. PF1-14]MDH6338506.1 uncharacterized protein YdhG (YjbR/CyaY superfamily) [Dysgonomonas sp. PF1-16]MDH6380046.1 uncharacterized protein YdhG (YjbR/CyaY superfamily) [Dysgonomonas sp. PFB1-18]MDH6397334.1 uncharacterized protein YdhG (YjbR/CyaY superfamily) [Dysgonomonas sp. PF1-23]
MKDELYNFYLDCKEPQKSALLALRSIILEYDENISETLKYGMPCFLYKKNILCYLWIDNKTSEPYILMTEGKYLSNPELEQGQRARMKIFRIDPIADLPLEIIKSILNDAINLYRKGIVKLK